MAEGLTGSSLRTPQRSLDTESGRMAREARKLKRQGFDRAAEQMALASSQQKIAQRPGLRSADTEIERQKLQLQADRETAAVESGMDSRRKLFNDMQGSARAGMTGAEGAQKLAGFRSRAVQLGIAPDRFAATAEGKLGLDLRALSQTPATSAVTPTMPTTPAAVTEPGTPKPAPGAVTEILRGARNLATVAPFPEQKKAAELGVLGGVPEFAAAVRAAGGFRKDAVAALNKERVAAGKPPVEPEAVYDMLLAQDRSVSARTAGPTPSSNPLYGAAGPALPPTPAFGAVGPNVPIGPALPRTPLPAVAPATPTPTAAPAAPQSRTLDEALRERFESVVDYPNRPAAASGSRLDVATAPARESIAKAAKEAADATKRTAGRVSEGIRKASTKAVAGSAWENSRLRKFLTGNK